MKEMKCKTCGGLLNIDEDKDFGVCPYCKTKYKLNDNKTISFKMDDNTKESITKGYKLFGKISLAIVIPFVLAFLLIISLAIYGIISFNKSRNNTQDSFFNQFSKLQTTTESSINDIYDKYKKNMEEYDDKFGKDFFNSKFEIYSGTQMGSSVSILLDKVVTSNKTNNEDNRITVIYGDIKTDNPDEIINLKSNFNTYSSYEVIIDYNDKGLINKITIENK